MTSPRDACRWMCEKLREIRENIPRPLKRFSQHYIRSCRVGYAFCKVLEDLGPLTVFELGAGVGFLTRFISSCSTHVVAVEIDYRLSEILRHNLSDLTNVHLLLGDGLQLLRSGCVRADILVSNSPYSLTGPLLSAYVKSELNAALITLQNEVARRINAKPGSREYGRVSVLIQAFNKVKLLDVFPPQYFTPKPKVSTRLVLLIKRRNWLSRYSLLEELTKCAFSQRRRKAFKVLGECLMKLGYDDRRVGEVLRDASVGGLRIYELSPETFLKIVDELT